MLHRNETTFTMLPVYLISFSLVLLIDHSVATYTKVYFPPSNQTQLPRLRMASSLPTMQEFTFCTRVKPYTLEKELTTLISYATSRSDNEIVIGIAKSDVYIQIDFHIGPLRHQFECRRTPRRTGRWYQICATWFAPTGTAEVHVNGDNCINQSSVLSSDRYIQGGGVFIIGQEQDAVDAKFDHNQSLVGIVADLHLWDEILSFPQIQKARECNGLNMTGNVLSLEDSAMSAFDGVVLSKSTLCEM